MGADIHLFCEQRKPDGTWKRINPLVPNPHYRPGSDLDWDFVKTEQLPIEETGPCNYDAFAILGDVRNGRGFAGIETGSGFNPIAPNRGLPADVSKRVKKQSDKWNGDGHSHNYLSLSELLDEATLGDSYWTQQTTHTGLVSPEIYRKWYEAGRTGWPISSCGDVSGRAVRKITETQMQHVLGILPAPPDVPTIDPRFSLYCRIQWGSLYSEAAGWYYSAMIPALVAYAAQEGLSHDAIRIVFWFDN